VNAALVFFDLPDQELGDEMKGAADFRLTDQIESMTIAGLGDKSAVIGEIGPGVILRQPPTLAVWFPVWPFSEGISRGHGPVAG
jgi:hypothetical protein